MQLVFLRRREDLSAIALYTSLKIYLINFSLFSREQEFEFPNRGVPPLCDKMWHEIFFVYFGGLHKTRPYVKKVNDRWPIHRMTGSVDLSSRSASFRPIEPSLAEL